jgi:hypothetical protein
MTQRGRTGYRRHGRAAWIAASVALLAAIVAVPLAIGANTKYYTLAASPTNACSTPAEQTFTLTLTNQTRGQNLGSANITAPSYISLEAGTQVISGTGYDSFTVDQPDGFDSTANTIRLRGLTLPTIGSAATITVKALVSVPAAGVARTWTSIVKQSNTFADSGPGNLFSFQPNVPLPTTTVSQCHYAFVQGPVNASKGVAQVVKVQLQDSNNNPTTVSGPLTLGATQNGNAADANFSGLTANSPDAGNQQWTFSVTGNVSGQGYALTAGATSSAPPSFTIADCIPVNGVCSVGFMGSGDGLGGGAFNGSGLNPDSAIVLSFASIPASGAAICQAGWGWSKLTFPPQPPDGRTNFDGITLSTFSMTPKGSMTATFYLRNDLFVQTTASQTNSIQVCAGAAHTVLPNGPDANAFTGQNGVKARWDPQTSLYWGVLQRVPNCGKPPADGSPALCAWGTQTINGIDYRTATVLIPYDWDWKGAT